MTPVFEHRFATAASTVLPLNRASVLFDGTLTQPRLLHPEGVAIGPDGAIWCSSELGQIMRVSADGSGLEEISSTGGFTLGLAFDGRRSLFVCDLAHAAVFRLDLATKALERFSSPGIRIPNFPVVDRQHNRLLVSDSYASGEAGPGLWAYDLTTGQGALLTDHAFNFANGMALSADGTRLLICETFSRKISLVSFAADGTVARIADFADDLPGLPDGLALDAAGNVFVGCYEPSRILRINADGSDTVVYIEDPTAHLFAHPTNLAFAGRELFTANLGRWHITRIASDTECAPLWCRPELVQ